VLLCERGDGQSVSHIIKQHLAEAKKVEALITVEALQKSLQDRQLFLADREFEGLKPVGPDELAGIHRGIQLGQHLYDLQRRGAIQDLCWLKSVCMRGESKACTFA
jgi:hypothetical protein